MNTEKVVKHTIYSLHYRKSSDKSSLIISIFIPLNKSFLLKESHLSGKTAHVESRAFCLVVCSTS